MILRLIALSYLLERIIKALGKIVFIKKYFFIIRTGFSNKAIILHQIGKEEIKT